MIREATMEDIPQLVDWGVEFHALARFPFEYQPHVTANSLANMIESDDFCILMHDHGFIIGALAPVWFSDVIQAAELAWWAEKDGLSLFRAFETWAAENGAHSAVMAHLEESAGEDDRVARIYERSGYTRAETGFRKVL